MTSETNDSRGSTVTDMSDVASLPEARSESLALLKKYLRASDEARTPILRELAGILVQARGHFHRADGSPDWKGRSYAYRQFVQDLYSELNVDKGQMNTIQAAVRYHVGAALREQLDEETLEDYDLQPKSPRERNIEQRATRSALLNALTAREITGGTLLALSAAFTVLSKVEAQDVAGLAERERDVAEETLADLERRVRALRKALA